MPVITNYAINSVKLLDLTAGPQTADVDLVSLADGGFAATGFHTDHTDIDLFNTSGNDTGSVINNTGTDAAIGRLSNGNIVLVSHVDGILGGNVFYKIFGPTGNVVLNTTDTNDSEGSTNPEVAGLAGGGFVMTYEQPGLAFGGLPAPVDIHVRLYNNAGTLITSFDAADGSTLAYHLPSVAALNDGGFVVAWQLNPFFSGNGAINYAVYNADGSVRLAPVVADNTGALNHSVNVVAQADGGFALAYVDSEWGTDTEITLAQYSAGGTFVRKTNVSADNEPNTGPHLTRLANGLLAVAYTQDFGTDNDTVVKLIDPASGATLATKGVLAGQDLLDNVVDPDLVGFTLGQIAVFHTNLTDGDVNGEQLQVVRTSLGDGLNNAILGDGLLDSMTGGGGNDTLDGGLGNDTLAGGTGDDLYTLVEAGDTVLEAVGEGIDTVTTTVALTLAANVENLQLVTVGNVNGTGNSLNNVLTGGGGRNNLSGVAGDDTLVGGQNIDTLNGGIGNDTADYSSATGGVSVELWNAQTSNDGQGASDVLTSIENVFGSAFNDSLSGDNNDNVLRGGAGFDGLFGGGGSDTADYATATGAVSAELWNSSASNDGQGASDFLNSIENLIGSAFNDTLVGDNNDNTFRGGAGNDGIYGGAGKDAISYSTATAAVAVDLAASYALDGQGGFDFLNDIENVIGSNFADYMNGSAVNNSFRGGAGNDSFVGGAGSDTADFSTAPTAVAVDLASNYAIDGQGGFDYLVSIENVIGSLFSDYLSGSSADNIFQGGGGLDTFVGGAGSDTVDYATWGSAVNINLSTFTAQMVGIEFNDDYLVGIENIIASAFGDTLIGDASANRIEGLGGNDFMAGVGGADTFAFGAGSGLDTVTDFSKAQLDKIALLSNVNGSGITTGALALARTFDAGGNAIVDLGGGNSVTLLGVSAASLAASDFQIF